jgi:hypothetical protein
VITVTNCLGEKENIRDDVREITDSAEKVYHFSFHKNSYAQICILSRNSQERAKNPQEPRGWIVAVFNGRDAVSYCTISFHKELGGADGALVKTGMLMGTHREYYLQQHPSNESIR